MTQERILVVDDEKGVVRSCVRILQREGFTTSGITDSHKVPELLRHETFDLLLTDIKMPKIDGLELLKIAKEIDPHITVVLITGYGTMEDAIEAIRLGAQGFLMKPFEPRDLLITINDNLARRTLVRDSLRLQTLLPLLEINQILQISGGEISLVKRVLKIAQKAIGATRLACGLKTQPPDTDISDAESGSSTVIEVAVVSDLDQDSQLSTQAIARVLSLAHPVWQLADGCIVDELSGQPNVVGALMPLIIKGEVVGVLTAETGNNNSGPFGQISLELLSVLAGQLAIIIENVQLFQQTEALRAFNEDIIQTMTNGLIATDKDNRITAFNSAASAMLGHQPDKLLYQPLSIINSGLIDNAEALVNVFDNTLKTSKAQPYQEISIQRQDGRLLPISVRTAPLKGKNKDSDSVGVVGVIEDLSEIKALEAERRRLDRLAALGEMAAVVAHEIRNPVAGIAAGVEYLTRNALKGSVEFEGASMMRGEIDRINRILEDILFVARPLQLNLSQASLPNLIENVIQRYQTRAQTSKVKFALKFAASLPPLYIDSQRLEQVFNNLILNAIQAMPEGGELSLEADIDKNNKHEDIIEITIADTGPGISLDRQQRIFEPFFTTKTKGTGLGLSIARRIIEEHQGTINVSREQNKGTRFIIKLPIAKGIMM